MSDKFPRLTAKQVEKILKAFGFELVSTKGSHEKWKNAESGKQVILPRHGGNPNLPIGTLKAIVDGSGIPEEDWKK